MAKDERMGAWLTRHSRQLVPLPWPYVVVGLLIFIPTSTLKKNHLLLNTKLKVNEKIIYYNDAILITCNVILVYKPFCNKTNSNFSVSHVTSY